MKLEDKIREAFSKKKLKEDTNKRFSKWDSERYPNIYEVDNFLRKTGYKLVDVLETEKGTPELIIEPVRGLSYLYPEISHDITTNTFYAKMQPLGMINASDIEGAIIGYENVLSTLRYLDSLDLKKLEIGNT